jgi:hypothetical protein
LDSDAADANLQTGLNANTAADAAAVAAGASADAVIQADVDQNEFDADLAYAALQTAQDANIAADIAESTAGDLADNSLFNLITALELLVADLQALSTATDTQLQVDLDALEQSTTLDVVVLSNLVNNFGAQVTTNTTSISAMDGTQIGQVNYWNGSTWVLVQDGFPSGDPSVELVLIKQAGVPVWIPRALLGW